MHPPPEPDLAGAAERLRSWLDEMAVVPALAPWHRTHAGPLIAAALALEELAAGSLGLPPDEEVDP